jgi:hypothetical protein
MFSLNNRASVESMLRNLVPGRLRAFNKLTPKRSPYSFQRWANDRAGMLCMYYSFDSRDGSTQNVKRVPIHEIEAALRHLQ